MTQITLQIEPKKKETDISKKPKTRKFQATLLGYVNANSMWKGGDSSGETNRPVWAMLAGTEQALRPFVANLQKGNRAEIPPENNWNRRASIKFEWLKSAGYRFIWQKIMLDNSQEPLSVVQIYLPELFKLDPGMIDPHEVKFICLTPQHWYQAEFELLQINKKLQNTVLQHVKKLGLQDWPERYRYGFFKEKEQKPFSDFTDIEILKVIPIASHFMAYLDTRTEKPLLPDTSFAVQLYFFALKEKLATLSTVQGSQWDWEPGIKNSRWGWAKHPKLEYHEDGTQQCGLLPGIQFFCTQKQLDDFLSEQVSLFYQEKKKKVG
jgi:hypothetical protein